VSLFGIRASTITLSVLLGAVLVGVPPAIAVEPTLSIRARAALHARGAAVVVEATETCPVGEMLALNAEVTQRLPDGSLIGGSGHRGVPCTGAPQTTRIAVPSAHTVQRGGQPFMTGPAFVTVSSSFCDPGCRTRVAARTVQGAAFTMNVARFTNSGLTLTLPPSASLEASGAGTIVRVPYRCTADMQGIFEARLLQRTSANAVTENIVNRTFVCSGINRTGVFAFHAISAAWVPGPAFLMLHGGICDDQRCDDGVYAHRSLTVG
jgi:hypothetical protein